MPVFSDKFVKALKSFGVDNFQTYKALLTNSETGESWDKYQVINVLGKVSCADMKYSIFKKLRGNYEFSRLVINSEKANGALFFRLLESPDRILIHDDVLDVMYDENDDPVFDGIDFELLESTGEIESDE